MIVEVVCLLVFCLSGSAWAMALRVPMTVTPPLGLVAGLVMYCMVAVLQIVLQLPTTPTLTLTVTALCGVAGLWSARRELRWQLIARRMAWLSAGVALAVLGFYKLNLIGYHTDTARYVEAARLLASGHMAWMKPYLLISRMASFPILLAPATLAGTTHLRSLFPMLSVAILWLLTWQLNAVLRFTSNHTTRPLQLAVILPPLVLLMSNDRFLWHSAYLNGHLLFAASLLVVVGFGWLRTIRAGLSAPATTTIVAGAAILAALDRPEGPLVVTMALLPLACSPQLGKLERLGPVAALGAALVVWYGYVCVHTAQTSRSVGISVWGMLGLGITELLAVAWFLRRRIPRWLEHLPQLVEFLVWVALGVFWLRKPKVLEKSLHAMNQNFLEDVASWGSSAWVLAVLVLLVLLLTKLPERRCLSFPVTTFVPLCLVFAYLRGEPYRDGDRDSLTRMAMHIVPLAVLLVGSSVLGRFRWQREYAGVSPPKPTSV